MPIALAAQPVANHSVKRVVVAFTRVSVAATVHRSHPSAADLMEVDVVHAGAVPAGSGAGDHGAFHELFFFVIGLGECFDFIDEDLRAITL